MLSTCSQELDERRSASSGIQCSSANTRAQLVGHKLRLNKRASDDQAGKVADSASRASRAGSRFLRDGACRAAGAARARRAGTRGLLDGDRLATELNAVGRLDRRRHARRARVLDVREAARLDDGLDGAVLAEGGAQRGLVDALRDAADPDGVDGLGRGLSAVVLIRRLAAAAGARLCGRRAGLTAGAGCAARVERDGEGAAVEVVAGQRKRLDGCSVRGGGASVDENAWRWARAMAAAEGAATHPTGHPQT